jgi:DnaJ-class molecular chaperone
VFEKDWQAEIRTLSRRDRQARAILGVSETAGRPEIRRAFREASRVNHPDVNPGDKDAEARFRLICCAYRHLTKGQPCAALDELEAPPEGTTDGKYRLDNTWGYWCWWREKYFDQTRWERSDADL